MKNLFTFFATLLSTSIAWGHGMSVPPEEHNDTIKAVEVDVESYTKIKQPSRREMDWRMRNVLVEGYTKVYHAPPRSANDLIRFIEAGSAPERQIYERELDYLKRHADNLEISINDTAILLKPKHGRVFFHGPLPELRARGDGMKGMVRLFDSEGYILGDDSLYEAFRAARRPVLGKYHPNWEPASEEFFMNKWRLAVFEATPAGLRPMYAEDAIDTTTDFFADMQRMALKFLNDHGLSRAIFDSVVYVPAPLKP